LLFADLAGLAMLLIPAKTIPPMPKLAETRTRLPQFIKRFAKSFKKAAAAQSSLHSS
jgi:hypothetical protein